MVSCILPLGNSNWWKDEAGKSLNPARPPRDAEFSTGGFFLQEAKPSENFVQPDRKIEKTAL